MNQLMYSCRQLKDALQNSIGGRPWPPSFNLSATEVEVTELIETSQNKATLTLSQPLYSKAAQPFSFYPVRCDSDL